MRKILVKWSSLSTYSETLFHNTTVLQDAGEMATSDHREMGAGFQATAFWTKMIDADWQT